MMTFPVNNLAPLQSRAVGLVGFWRLDQASGNMIDSGRFGYNLSNAGSPTRSVAGKWGLCTQYDGVDAIDYTTQAGIGTTFASVNTLTISFWASATALADLKCAISLGDNQTDNMIGIYPYWDEAGVARVRVWYNGTYEINVASGVLANSTLNHFCYRQSGATAHEMFVNGVSVQTDATSKTLPAGTDIFCIGNFGNGGWASEYYTHKIDHVKLWNRALTNAEIFQDSRHG